jgi:hypothetical protein
MILDYAPEIAFALVAIILLAMKRRGKGRWPR